MNGRSATKPPWTEHPRVHAIRQRSPAIDVGVQTLDAYNRHRSGRNAALIAHFGFVSIFPLVLALTTALGFVLRDRPDLQEDIIDSALSRVPIIGQTIGTDPAELKGSAAVLAFGLLAALWSGLRAFVAVQFALDDVREVPREARPNYAVMRVRALTGVAVIGGSQLATAIITAIVGAASFTTINRMLLALGVLGVNVLAVCLTFRWLCSSPTTWRRVLPGALTAGVLFSAMQFVGTTVVARLIANASPVYGTFASVIGLITWLSLHAMVALFAAELNEVLHRRRVDSPTVALHVAT